MFPNLRGLVFSYNPPVICGYITTLDAAVQAFDHTGRVGIIDTVNRLQAFKDADWDDFSKKVKIENDVYHVTRTISNWLLANHDARNTHKFKVRCSVFWWDERTKEARNRGIPGTSVPLGIAQGFAVFWHGARVHFPADVGEVYQPELEGILVNELGIAANEAKWASFVDVLELHRGWTTDYQEPLTFTEGSGDEGVSDEQWQERVKEAYGSSWS